MRRERSSLSPRCSKRRVTWSNFLKQESKIEALAGEVAKARDVLYLGRGVNFPLAMEGALKLKEISYIHAEGYAAGEMKHGPIALIDENVPVIVIAPHDSVYEKTASNMQEVMARGGKVVLISDARGILAAGEKVWASIEVPETDSDDRPARLFRAGAIARLLHGAVKRHRCGPAAQSGEVGHRRIKICHPRRARALASAREPIATAYGRPRRRAPCGVEHLGSLPLRSLRSLGRE